MPEHAPPIPITKPVFGKREQGLLLEPLKSGWLVQGPYVERFEKDFSAYTGAKHSLAATSCTTALHLILYALGIGPGDEVIVPSFTYVATANTVEYVGARPVFCDIDLASYNIDLMQAERLIGPRTKAILPVSLFGLSADLPGCLDLAKARRLHVIEDAACALGAKINGVHSGVLGTAAAFSFHPRKAITTGEGGMVTTNDDQLADLVAKLRNHGAEATDLERHLKAGGSLLPSFNLLGFNYRMTDLQGALGVAQMERAEDLIAGRRAAAANYDALFSVAESVRVPVTPKGYDHAYQSYVVAFTGGHNPSLDNLKQLNLHRNRLMAQMEKDGISVRQGTHAVHTLGYYQRKYGIKPEEFPMSLLADRLSIALPLFMGIKPKEQERVADYLLNSERYI